jgi:uncharacterized protein (DUF2126 family)
MARKNHNPQAADMKTIVPIHNAVNERAWTEILKWEAGRGGETCGGVKLINFKGRPNDKTPRARWKMLLGYVVHWCSVSFFFMFAGMLHLLTGTIGSWTDVGYRRDMSLTFIQDEVILQQIVRHSFWMCDLPWTVGKVLK